MTSKLARKATTAGARSGSTPTMRRDDRRSATRRLHLLWLLLGLVIVAAVAVAMTFPQVSAEPPGLVYVTAADGVRMAQFDVAEVSRWCRAHDLPDPPALGSAEPAIAVAVIDALREVAREPSALNLGRVGMLSESLECHATATWYFQAARKRDPRDFRWPYYLACIQQAIGRNKEAIKLFLEVVQLEPRYATTYARLGQLYLENAEMERAEHYFQPYVAMAPQDSLGYVGLARISLGRGELDQALQYAMSGVQYGPNEFHAHYALARVFAALGRAEEAQGHFDACAALPKGLWLAMHDPLDQELHRTTLDSSDLVRELEKMGPSRDWAKKVELAGEIVQRRPGDAVMLTNLAGFYRKLKRYDDAHRVLDRAESVNPDLVIVHESRAELLLAEGQHEKSLEAAAQCLALDPDSYRAQGVRGRALLLLGRVNEAIEALQACVAARFDDPGNIFVLGEALLAAGRMDEASRSYERVLVLAPDREDARQRLAQINDRMVEDANK